MVETLSNVAADLNLSLMQGKYWSTIMTIKDATGKPINVTGYIFRGQIRKTVTSPVTASFTFTIADALAGSVRAELLSDQTSKLTALKYVYDWEYEDVQGEEHALIKGNVNVIAEVTHV
jgi:hypothetical protein